MAGESIGLASGRWRLDNGAGGGATYIRTYGNRAIVPAAEAMSVDTLFDAASLTMILVTATAIVQLAEEGRLTLNDRIAQHLPALAVHGKGAITIRHLLTHMSGLRPSLPQPYTWTDHAGAVAAACAEEHFHPIGSQFVYSDIGFITLGEIIRVCSGQSLDAYAQEKIFQPLGFSDTSFLPAASLQSRIAPCDASDPSNPASPMLRSVVHDPTARRMAGVVGHAGVITTIEKLARFCHAILHGGELDGQRTLSADSITVLHPANALCAAVLQRSWTPHMLATVQGTL